MATVPVPPNHILPDNLVPNQFYTLIHRTSASRQPFFARFLRIENSGYLVFDKLSDSPVIGRLTVTPNTYWIVPAVPSSAGPTTKIPSGPTGGRRKRATRNARKKTRKSRISRK